MLLIAWLLFLSFFSAVPPLSTSTVSPSLALLANNLSMPPSDLPPGASPRKKPRKQQHVISTEEGDMMETNSTDDEKSTAKSLLVKAEKRKSPPKEYIGNVISANLFSSSDVCILSSPYLIKALCHSASKMQLIQNPTIWSSVFSI